MARAWVLSGGASKGAFTVGVVEQLLKKDADLQFDYAIGTSTGALIAGPVLLGDTDYLANSYTTMTNSDILRNTLIGRILQTPLNASMEPLHQQLKDYFLKRGKLDALIHSGKTQVVTCVNVRTGKVHLISSRMVRDGQISPATFVKGIVASCSPPVMTKPVRLFEDEPESEYRHDLFYDGGVKEFLPFEHAVALGASEIWGVSTHRLETAETEWGGTTTPQKVGILHALKWTIGSLLDEVARGDRFRADCHFRLAQAIDKFSHQASLSGLDRTTIDRLIEPLKKASPFGHNLTKLYLIYPSTPMGTSFEFDPRIMLGYYRQGCRAAERFLEKGKPLFSDQTLADWAHQVN